MTLTFKHFDTRLNQWLHFDGNTNNPDSLVEEKLDNTLLEFFLPKQEFSFGQMDEYSTAKDLKNHPNSHQLLLSSKERLLYGSKDCLEVIDKLCPDRKDRGAYGSIFLGSCNNAIQEKLNVLVVDDKTGENGGIINAHQAWRLTGDCYGQIDPRLHDLLTNRTLDDNKPYAVSQHRFGWTETDGEDCAFRFGKGTLRPYELDELEYVNEENTPKIDLIVPLSSFKGTDKDNPNGPSKPQIAPGLYKQTIWLGEKSRSQQGKTAISQLLASFPKGLSDFIDEVDSQAKELAQIQDDPRLVAQLYCKSYEKRQIELEDENHNNSIDEIDLNEDHLESEGLDGSNSDRQEALMYKIIKADVASGHYQLVETEKVKQELSRFVQKRWRDIAIGRTLTFDRGLIIPSKDLKNGEIYVPWMEAGEKVLNFRSPFLNSNGLCVSVNKFTEDCLGPDGKKLTGVIVVNDEDLRRIRERVKALEAEGLDPETIPDETESERQGRDFDGDCIGVALAANYPNLTKEAEYRNLPENAYSPTVKQAKQSFYNSDGTQPEFEDIAIFMAKGNVGTINNQVTALEALESEIEILKAYGTKEQVNSYINQVADRYNKLLYLEAKHDRPIREEYKPLMQELITLAKNASKNPENTIKILDLNRHIYRNLIEEGCFQNQIAVDNFKSSKPPDMELINENKRYLPRQVNYIKDKKLPTTYLSKPIVPSGSSPVELLISQTNKHFFDAALESRTAVQFSKLFEDVEFTPQQALAATTIKREYEQCLQEAVRLNNRLKSDPGPYAVIQTPDKKSIEITNLAKYSHPKIWQGKVANMELKEAPDDPSKLLAVAQIDLEVESNKPKYRELGIINSDSVKAFHLEKGMKVDGTILEINPGLQASQIKLAFAKVQELATNFYTLIPEADRQAFAAAAWQISTVRENEDFKSSNAKRVSSFVYQTFSNEIASQLKRLQLTELKITGVNREENFSDRWTSQDQYPIEIISGDQEQNLTRQICLTDSAGTRALMPLDAESSRLPIGTKAIARVVADESATINATVAAKGKPSINFTIREVSKFNYSNRIFVGEEVNLTVGSALVPSNKINVLIDGKILGELDKNSAKELADIDINFTTALKLKLTLYSSSQKYGSFIIGESPDGNLLKINKVDIDTFAKCNIDSNKLKEIRLEANQSIRKDAVFLNNKLLGTLHKKDERDALKQLGLMQVGKLVQGKYELKSNFTTAKILIDPNKVEYPQKWTKESESVKKLAKQDITNASVLTKLKERPTLLFGVKENDEFRLINIAVDENKNQAVETWLKTCSIDFKKVPLPEMEASKGMSLYSLIASTIQDKDLAALKVKYGEVMDVDSYQKALAFVPRRSGRQVEGMADAIQQLLTSAETPASSQQPIDVGRSNPPSSTLPTSPVPKSSLSSNNAAAPQPQIGLVREQWEQNLISSAFTALNSTSNTLDNYIRTASFGAKHSVSYNTLENKLSIYNNSSKQIVYQAVKGQAATISNLLEEQKQYFSNHDHTSNNSNRSAISNSSTSKVPGNDHLAPIHLSNVPAQISELAQIDDLNHPYYQADLKIAVKGLIAGSKLSQIKQEILEQSKAVSYWHNTETPAKALANTVRYLDKLCEEAEVFKVSSIVTASKASLEENLYQKVTPQTSIENKSSRELER